jgi:uncharacterized membrane protein
MDKDQKIILWSMLFVAIIGAFYVFSQARSFIWFDEAYSVLYSSNSLSYILQPHDVHPPLYYVLLHIWTSGQIQQSWVYRAMSMLFGIWCVPFLYMLVKRWYNGKYKLPVWCLVLFMMFGLITVPMYYFSEIRMYGMMLFFSIASFYFLDTMIRTEFKKGKIGYTIFTILLMWSHYFSFYFLPMHIIYLLMYLDKKKIKEYLKVSYVMILSLIISLGLEVAYFLVQRARIMGTWYRDTTPWAIASTIFYNFGHHFGGWISDIRNIYDIFFLLLVGIIIFLGIKYTQDKEQEKLKLFLAITIFIPPLLGMLVNLFVVKSYHHRFFLQGFWCMYVLLALCFITIYERRKILAIILLSIFVIWVAIFTMQFWQGVGTAYVELEGAVDKVTKDYCNYDINILHEGLISGAPQMYYSIINKCKSKTVVLTDLTDIMMNSAGYDMIPNRENMLVYNTSALDKYVYFRAKFKFDENDSCITDYTSDGLYLDVCYNKEKYK